MERSIMRGLTGYLRNSFGTQTSWEKVPKMLTGISTLKAMCLSLMLLSLLLCTSSVAVDIYSGNKYIFSTAYNENYIYQWSASAGNYQENDKNTLAWLAPNVDSSTDIMISVSVTDKSCGCHSIFDKTITVIPNKETKPNIKFPSNNSNTTSIDENKLENNTQQDLAQNHTATESVIILSGKDSNQVIAFAGQENATQTDLLSGSNSVMNTENYSANIATRYDALSTINANPSPASEGLEEASDQRNQATIAEKPLAAEVQNDQNQADETCTLSFDNGIKVDVVFEQSNSLADTAIVMLQEAAKEVIGSPSSPDGTNTPASLTNMTLAPDPGIDQSGADINQTKAENALPEIVAGSSGKTDETPEQSNTLEIGSEAAAASPDPNENPPEQAINQTNIGIN